MVYILRAKVLKSNVKFSALWAV